MKTYYFITSYEELPSGEGFFETDVGQYLTENDVIEGVEYIVDGGNASRVEVIKNEFRMGSKMGICADVTSHILDKIAQDDVCGVYEILPVMQGQSQQEIYMEHSHNREFGGYDDDADHRLTFSDVGITPKPRFAA